MWVVEEGALPEKEVEGPLAGAVVLGEEIDFWAMELLVEGGIPMDGEGKGRKLLPFLQRIGAVQLQAVGVLAGLLLSVEAGQGCGNKENYE